MPSNHLILCRSLLLLPSIFPSIRVFSGYITVLHFFLLPNYIPLHGYNTYCLCIHQYMDSWCFHLLTDINNVAMNIHVQVFVWAYIFTSLGYITRSGIVGSHGNSVFNHLSKCHVLSHSVVSDSLRPSGL